MSIMLDNTAIAAAISKNLPKQEPRNPNVTNPFFSNAAIAETIQRNLPSAAAQGVGGGAGAGGGDTAGKTLVGTKEVYDYNGVVRTMNIWSDGTTSENEPLRRTETSAGDDVKEIFRAAGLDENFINSLVSTIDAVYATNVKPTASQIQVAINTSEAYKQRFKGNEAIRQRMAGGQGRPGDRLLTPAEYIALERTYRTIFADNEMPAGYYDNVDDFANLIGNSVSAAELQSRVDTAKSALREADNATLNTLQQYYNLSQGDLVSYLLDPTRAMPILEARQTQGQYGLNSREELQRQYAVAQVGGAAARQGMEAGQALSEEIVQQGKGQYAEQAFAQAGAENENVKRLGSLYGEPLDFKDMVKETLSLTGGVEAGKKRRKFASKERAAFGGQGALDKSSLSRRQDV
jgi:hypothetical protein